ncbi:MAG: tRNA (adenosine(37)-N6)-threonylcarbamoyltransferase complex ATPase subunit type 1 TsaE, partial [Cloacibacillus sp.]
MKFHIHSDKTLRVATNCPQETYELGRRLGALAFPGLLVLLNGTLGVGKTKFTQGFGAALGYSRVKSPSFIIMSEYDGPLPMLHADLYRLERSYEAETLGIEEYLEDGFTALVEWAERWSKP